MKVTKLPDEYDINHYNEEKIVEKSKYCPYCGTEDDLPLMCKTWCGKKDEDTHPILSTLRFWEKDRHYKITCFSCRNCGASWETEPYVNECNREEIIL